MVRRIARWSGVASLSAVLLAGTSLLPAQAAQGFTVATDGSDTDGSAHATGQLTFSGRHTIAVYSEVWDACPGDGDGAYLAWGVRFTDGYGVSPYYENAFNKDINGCGNGRSKKLVDKTWPREVYDVRLCVFEVDADLDDVKAMDCSRFIKNPHV